MQYTFEWRFSFESNFTRSKRQGELKEICLRIAEWIEICAINGEEIEVKLIKIQ